jgi:hypothetical protein
MPAPRKLTTDSSPPTTAVAPTLQSRFDGVLGERRGLTDARAALARLRVSECELERTEREGWELKVKYEHLSDGASRLHDVVAEQNMKLESRSYELQVCRRDLRRARYALVRAVGVDGFARLDPDTHHGVWTPGRPYLAHEHVYGPADGYCYCAQECGVAVGQAPGSARDWVRCAASDPCPKPEVVPVHDHPVESGYAVRQVEFWWDRHKRWYALHELTDEHLQGVVRWLGEHSYLLWQEELDEDLFYVPCPALAYEDDIAWLDDTPLMRALDKELASRGLPAADAQLTTELAESSQSAHKGKN